MAKHNKYEDYKQIITKYELLTVLRKYLTCVFSFQELSGEDDTSIIIQPIKADRVVF